MYLSPLGEIIDCSHTDSSSLQTSASYKSNNFFPLIICLFNVFGAFIWTHQPVGPDKSGQKAAACLIYKNLIITL